MYKYQLFQKIPPQEFVEDIINLYGPNGFDVNYYFTLDDLVQNNIIDKLNNKIDDLKQYYLPCKWHYITNITLQKTITILRQLLRPYNYKLYSSEKYTKGKKYLLYNLIIIDKELPSKNLVIKFE